MYLSNLQRQHKEIFEVVNDIRKILGRNNIEEDASQIASQISLLAGKLKVHLSSEDKHMYPSLIESTNMELRKTAREFIDDMGHISGEFMAFKEKFNTKSKIAADTRTFAQETEKVFNILETRIRKEESSLYTLL